MVVEQNAARALAVADRGVRARAGAQSIRGHRARPCSPTPRSSAFTSAARSSILPRGLRRGRTTVLMRIAWPSAIASAALAAVLIGILVLFQSPVGQIGHRRPQPAEPAPKGPRRAAGHAAPRTRRDGPRRGRDEDRRPRPARPGDLRRSTARPATAPRARATASPAQTCRSSRRISPRGGCSTRCPTISCTG